MRLILDFINYFFIKKTQGTTPTYLHSFLPTYLHAFHLYSYLHSTSSFQFGQNNLSLAVIFEKLELFKQKLHIDHYSVSQTTLEQVSILDTYRHFYIFPYILIIDV